MEATTGQRTPDAADAKRRQFGIMWFSAIVVAGVVGTMANQVKTFEGAMLLFILLLLVFLTGMKLYELW